MTVQVLKKWGNSPAVRIPAAIMHSAQLALDQRVEVRAEGGRIIIEPVVPAYTLDALLNGIIAENQHAEVDFGIAQGQEQYSVDQCLDRFKNKRNLHFLT